MNIILRNHNTTLTNISFTLINKKHLINMRISQSNVLLTYEVSI